MDALAIRGLHLLCNQCFKHKFTKKEMGCIMVLMQYLYDNMRDTHAK
jgi:hypothetical protein